MYTTQVIEVISVIGLYSLVVNDAGVPIPGSAKLPPQTPVRIHQAALPAKVTTIGFTATGAVGGYIVCEKVVHSRDHCLWLISQLQGGIETE